ncbi:hypothetical protein H310_04334 [Aphanomyces invadans]|uniref:Transposase Tc1-like domain-containing protein n=1 Tax=Aphanomyces invadans TaxID=157072 RepID=A0A024UCK8_9STRA|nr:hypothetical protein H310_04334 [Aphanomyces invadans]ETW03915.1 hypothetical protein H310_04334 [Aphanomyces invadans]|eukprot:XP_008866871.1 hypothetical protein H310_04334 [Aphanomyces invadans]
MRDMSEGTGIPLGSLHRALKAGTLQRRSTRIKPLLSDTNQEQRWFNADKNVRKVYLTAGEEPEQRAWSSKRFIPKVMFLAAVARPRHDPERDINVDGKIGIWPIVEFLPAVRSSRNRPAGSLVPTLVNLNAAVYRKYVITRVIPAIKLKFHTANNALYPSMTIQHPMVALPTLTLRGVSTNGWTFVVRCQRPNSPDLNVLDLSSFASIQTLQYKLVSRSLGEAIHATYAAFELCGGDALANVLLTLQ